MAERQATCAECGAQFSFLIGRGTTRSLCGESCRKASALKRKAQAEKSYPQCSIDGCEAKSRSGRSRYCEAHYYRVRRNGTVKTLAEVSPPDSESLHSEGYILEWAPDHPLTSRTTMSRVYQHRRVYYDENGEGPFNCHWCGTDVTWADMHVDHVNAVRDDNRVENLVASCPACNVKRGAETMTAVMRLKSNAKITWRGESLTAGQWAERIGITAQSLRSRIKSGWALDRALTERRGNTGPRPEAR